MKVSSTIETTINATTKNYRSYPGVCGVSFGAKFSDGTIQEGIQAIQFFVTEKLDLDKLSRRLPQHVFKRTDGGAVDRKSPIPTDVIELKNLRLCCFAGDGVGNELGVEGSVALIFDNQADGGTPMLLTCSHVASDLVSTDATFDLAGGRNDCFFQATTTAFTTISGDRLEFDIALAEITQIDDLQPLELRDMQGVFTGFASPEEFIQGDTLDCQSSRANAHSIELQSSATTFRNVHAYDAGEITVSNLYACKGKVDRGDSGGLVYLGEKVVGIIVAKADDHWVFIHALDDALDFLKANTGLAISIFL